MIKFVESDADSPLWFDHDELIIDYKVRPKEEGWTPETCQHRSREMNEDKSYTCFHCGRTVSADEIWRPKPSTGSPFVDL